MPVQVYHLFSGFALVLGLVVGSFLNVVIARMPEDRSIVHPPSHCPACGAFIKPYDNIPVLSWLLLRGRCRSCDTAISPLYPTIELLTGLLAWLVFRRVVPGPADLDLAHLVAFAVFFGFVAMLVAQTCVDLRHGIILDQFSIYAVPLGVAAAALLTRLGYPGAITWRQSVLGALFGSGLLLFVVWMYRGYLRVGALWQSRGSPALAVKPRPGGPSVGLVLLGSGVVLIFAALGGLEAPARALDATLSLTAWAHRRLYRPLRGLVEEQPGDGMGFGDVKLLAMMGAFLGAWPALPFTIFVASVVGSLVGIPVSLARGLGLKASLPFGPFLALAAIVYVVHGPELVERWLPGWSVLVR